MLVVLFSLLGLGSCVPFLGIGSSLFISGSHQDPPVACVVQGTCYQGRWAQIKQAKFFFIRNLYYRWTNSSSGKPYSSFQGVRYAQPPLGERRCLILFFFNRFKYISEGSATLSLFWLVRSCTMCQRSRLSSVRNLAG